MYLRVEPGRLIEGPENRGCTVYVLRTFHGLPGRRC